MAVSWLDESTLGGYGGSVYFSRLQGMIAP